MLHVTSREKYYRGHWLVDGEITKMEEVPTLEHVLVLVDACPKTPRGCFWPNNHRTILQLALLL